MVNRNNKEWQQMDYNKEKLDIVDFNILYKYKMMKKKLNNYKKRMNQSLPIICLQNL